MLKDLTNLLEFVITLVIIEINGANFAYILLIHKGHKKNFNFFFLIRGVERGVFGPKQVFIYINIFLPMYHYCFQDFRSDRILDHDKIA